MNALVSPGGTLITMRESKRSVDYIQDPMHRHCRRVATTMLACDLFHVDTVPLRGIDALFFIELDTRRVYLRGVTTNPVGE